MIKRTCKTVGFQMWRMMARFFYINNNNRLIWTRNGEIFWMNIKKKTGFIRIFF